MISHRMLPATADELAEETGLSHEDVYSTLVLLEGMGLVRVVHIRGGKNCDRLLETEWHAATHVPTRAGSCGSEAAMGLGGGV